MYDFESIRKRLKEVREKTNLSMRQFGIKAGIPETTYIQIESGKTKKINLEYLQKVSETYDVNPNWLMFGEEIKPVIATPEEQKLFETVKKASGGDKQALEQLQFLIDCLKAKTK